jgi:CHAD domain-containing protein
MGTALSSAPELLGDTLVSLVEAIDGNQAAVQKGDDPDALHDMRVAVRRLRATLRAVRPLTDRNHVDGLRRELEWLGDGLGAVRDLDVLILGLRADADGLDAGDAVVATTLLHPLIAKRESAQTALITALESDRYRHLLEALRGTSAGTLLRRDDVTLEQLAAKEYRRLRKRGEITPSMSAARLHKRRIRIKRARYTAELVESRPKVKKFVLAAKHAQDALGVHHDAVVARRRLRELSGAVGRANTALVAGRLIELQQARIERARDELPEVWTQLCRRGDRAWRR